MQKTLFLHLFHTTVRQYMGIFLNVPQLHQPLLQFMAVALFSGHFLLQHGLGMRPWEEQLKLVTLCCKQACYLKAVQGKTINAQRAVRWFALHQVLAGILCYTFIHAWNHY